MIEVIDVVKKYFSKKIKSNLGGKINGGTINQINKDEILIISIFLGNSWDKIHITLDATIPPHLHTSHDLLIGVSSIQEDTSFSCLPTKPIIE